LGCQLLDIGVDEGTVRQIYGHTNQKMTQLYSKRSVWVMTEALEKRSKIIDFKKKNSQPKNIS